ncbi:MAG: zinc-ribbon domain-containing protein [bacterium]
MNKCPNCQNENEREAQFCAKCGAALHSKDRTYSVFRNRAKTPWIAAGVVFLCGGVNIALWLLWDAGDRMLFINYFSKLNAWLWLGLYGRLICGLLLLSIGIIGLLGTNLKVQLIEVFGLIITGIWNVANDFFAIPGLQAYNRPINIEMILQDLNISWLLLGFLQFGLALILVLKFTSIQNST